MLVANASGEGVSASHPRLVPRLMAAEAASAQHMSLRTLYRYRHEGLEELALTLSNLWRERAAAQPAAGAVALEPGPEGIPRLRRRCP